MKLFLTLVSLTLACAGALAADKHKLVEQWRTDPVLMVPEAVLYDAERKCLFVSNIEGSEPWAKDGKGSIAKVGLDGKVINRSWVDGINAPKGLGLYQGRLYVADVDRVVVVSIEAEKIEKSITVPGAKRLNDLTVDEAGVVYVSDSETGTIHAIEDGKASVFVDDFKSPNGVLAADDSLYVLDQETLYRVGEDRQRKTVVEGLVGHVDGVEKVGEKGFIVSCWNGVIYYAEAGSAPEKLLDTSEEKINAADIGYDPKNRIVYVPTFWKNSVVAYRLQ